MSDEQQMNIIELQRRLFSLIQLGTIHSADYDKALVRVQIGDLVTGWLHWGAKRAGGDVEWCPVEVGEQVAVFSPSGDLAQAFILGSFYQTSHPAPANVETVHHIKYADGTIIEYDRASHTLTVNVQGGDVLVTTTGNANVSADVDITASAGGKLDVTATGDANVNAANVNVTASADVNIDGANIKLNQGTSGGVVCQSHVCTLTGAPHPQGSATVMGGG